MKDFAEKFRAIESELSEQKGPFNLFALFLREGSPSTWDLLINAPWAEDNKSDALKLIAKQVTDQLGSSGMTYLSRIVLIEPDNPGFEAITNAFSTEHGLLEVKETNLFGLQIEHAYIITSRRPDRATQ